VTSMLTAASIPPEMLQFEITDGIAPLQADYVAVNLSRLRDCGVRFALDGFGSRSANLLNLRDLDIDVIKLDPAMSRDALDGSRSMNVLRSILSLAGQLGIEVIAKGIETVQQHELLLQIGCRYGQGYLYSPPRAMGELDLGSAFDVHPPGTAPDEAHRRALIRSIAATGAPDAADIAALVRSVAQRNGADMGVMAMVEDGVRWASWEMSSRCDPEPPEIEALVRAVCATGPMAINDMIGRGYVQSPNNGCGAAVRSLTAVPVTTSDGSAIGALCLLWLDPMRPGCQDTDDLALSADHIASRIELAFLRSHLALAGR